MLTRRQFFARMRKLGFNKSRFQLTRIGITYENNAGVKVTVPKHHESTFTILGETPISGIYVEDIGKDVNWGTRVNPSDLGMSSMLEVCLGLLDGRVVTGATE